MTYLCDSCGLRRVTFARVYALVTALFLFISYLTVQGTTSLHRHLAVPLQSQLLRFEALTKSQTMRMFWYLAGPCQPPGSHMVCAGFPFLALSQVVLLECLVVSECLIGDTLFELVTPLLPTVLYLACDECCSSYCEWTGPHALNAWWGLTGSNLYSMIWLHDLHQVSDVMVRMSILECPRFKMAAPI